MRGDVKPKQPIVGISLEQWEFDEVKAICGGEKPGWVARQLLYRWVLAMRAGTEKIPDRHSSLDRLPRVARAVQDPDASSGGDLVQRRNPAAARTKP